MGAATAAVAAVAADSGCAECGYAVCGCVESADGGCAECGCAEECTVDTLNSHSNSIRWPMDNQRSLHTRSKSNR